MPPKFKYAEGEKVLCYHGPLLYEAKVGIPIIRVLDVCNHGYIARSLNAR